MSKGLVIKSICKSYGNTEIFHDFSIEFEPKGLYSIVGRSGCGKSTLLNIISLVDESFDGKITFNNNDLSNLTTNEKELYRLKHIGYVFQNFNLFNLDSALNNVLFPLETISNESSYSKKRRAKELLEYVGLKNKEKQIVNTLSGGEKQRVAIARALINDPDILLCDEPTGALDEKTSKQIFELLMQISETKLVIVVSHNVDLSKKYSLKMITLKDGKISNIETQLVKTNKIRRFIFEKKHCEKKPQMSLRFLFKHSFSSLQSKKKRTAISVFMTSLGLVGVGMTILISSSIGNEIKRSFSSAIGEDTIVMKKKSNTNNLYGNIIATNLDETYSIMMRHSDTIDGIGINYLVNFEEFFFTNNSCYLTTDDYRIRINNLSARSFNDYVWLEDNVTFACYPKVSFMENDQVVLGLPFESMKRISGQLGIEGTYENLGFYLANFNALLSFEVVNSDWEYDDKESFNIVGVTESYDACLYHSNHLWNEWLFEEKMRLPTTANKDNVSRPWQLSKYYYLHSKDKEMFYQETYFNLNDNEYIFDNCTSDYYPGLNFYKFNPFSNRIMVFLVDKECIDLNIIKNVRKSDLNLGNYTITNDLGYSLYNSSLTMGFTNDFFLSNSEEKIDEIIDNFSKVDDVNGDLELEKEVVVGSATRTISGGLIFSIIGNNEYSGERPNRSNEILISSNLYEKFDRMPIPFDVYCTMSIGQKQNGNMVEKLYSKNKMRVVGVVEEKKDVLYQNYDWTISFFRDYLGISSFFLLPRYVVFDVVNQDQISTSITNLQKKFYNYEFTAPTKEMTESIDETLGLVKTILLIFSSVSFVISMLLFMTVIYLNIIENKNEIILFKYIGISDKEVEKYFVVYGFLIGMSSFLVSACELIILNFVFNYVLADYFSTSFSFVFNYEPILIILIISALTSLVFGKIISKITIIIENKRRNAKFK